MRAARVRGSTLAWEDAGAGEPVVCIHGAFIADAFRPLLSERVLTDGWRVVTYHRRGYGASSGATDAAPSLADQAADCWGLLAHLGVERAHVVGHSFGGAVALRLALDTPATVATLTLLEAGLLAGESEPVYRQGLLEAIDRYRHAGATAAVDAFLAQRWPPYRRHLDDVLPGAFAQAVADAGTCFDVDLPGGLASRLGELELRRLEQPTLVVLGEASVALHPRFEETYRLLLQWLPNAEGSLLPGLSHFLQLEDPRVVARTIAGFLARHPLAGSGCDGRASR